MKSEQIDAWIRRVALEIKRCDKAEAELAALQAAIRAVVTTPARWTDCPPRVSADDYWLGYRAAMSKVEAIVILSADTRSPEPEAK
jgi:hypothetical protein